MRYKVYWVLSFVSFVILCFFVYAFGFISCWNHYGFFYFPFVVFDFLGMFLFGILYAYFEKEFYRMRFSSGHEKTGGQ